MQKLLLVYYYSENRGTSQIWNVLPNMVFPLIWGGGGGGNGGVLSMRMQVILDSSFAPPGSAPIRGGKKGEFRDWTTLPKNIMFSIGKTNHFLPAIMEPKIIVMDMKNLSGNSLQKLYLTAQLHQITWKNVKGIATPTRRRCFTISFSYHGASAQSASRAWV